MESVKFLLALALCALPLFAADITAVRREGAISIDGKLDEADWGRAVPYTDFTNARTGKKALVKNEVRFLYDSNGLYVGMRANMLPGQTYNIDDRNLYAGECMELMLDPGAGANTYFHFMLNPNGVRYDAFRDQGGFVGDPSWDAEWKSAVHREDSYWSCEMLIPYASLDFPIGDSLRWNVNCARGARGLPDNTQEDCSIAIDGAYHVAGKFRSLEGFGRSFSQYGGWQLSRPQLSISKAVEGLSVDVEIAVSNNGEAGRKAQLCVDLVSLDKETCLRKVQLGTFNPGKTEKLRFRGYRLPGPGDFKCALILQNGETKRVLRKQVFDAPVSFQALDIDLRAPRYKNAIFSTMKLENVLFDVKVALPADRLKGRRLLAGIKAGDGRVLAEKEAAPAEKCSFSFPVAPLPEEKMTIFAKLIAEGQTEAEATHPLRKLAYLPGEVWINDQYLLVRDGKPVFLIGQWAAEEDYLEGVDAFVAWKPFKGTLKMSPSISHNRVFTELKKRTLVTSDEERQLRETARKDRDSEGMLLTYLADEPEVFGSTVENLQSMYNIVTDEVPYFPLMNSNDTAPGLWNYLGTSDVNGLHSYPLPSRTRQFAQMDKVLHLMDAFAASHAAEKSNTACLWCAYCFDYTNYAAVNTRIPTYLEMRTEFLMAMICGAGGMEVYNRFNTHYPEVGIGLQEFIREVKSYAPVLAEERLTPDLKLPEGFRWTARKHNGKWWLFIVNCSDNEARNVSVNLPELGNSTLRAMTEERSVKAENGVFKDDFPGWDVRVYTNDDSVKETRSRRSIEAEIAAANARRRKPGNLAFQMYEAESLDVTASSNAGKNVRADNCLWHVTDGVVEPPDFKHYYANQLVWRDATPDAAPDWIALDFRRSVKMERVVVYPVEDSLKEYEIQVQEGDEWKTVAAKTDASGPVQELRFPSVTASKLRVFIKATRGRNARITEIEVY